MHREAKTGPAALFVYRKADTLRCLLQFVDKP